MRIHNKLTGLAILVLLFLLTQTIYGANGVSKLQGTWENSEHGATLKFLPNSELEFEGETSPYTLVSGAIQVDYEDYPYRFQGDNLFVTIEGVEYSFQCTDKKLDVKQTFEQDSGFSITYPFEIESTMELQGSYTLELGHRNGMIFSENPDSPFHYATLFSQGTVFRDEEGIEVGEVSLIEMTDRHGDTAWLAIEFWFENGVPVPFDIIGGTGKWKYITGKGKIMGEVGQRIDHHPTIRWEASWKIDEEGIRNYSAETIAKEQGYTHIEEMMSFHGPHVPEGLRKPGNGLQLVPNTQKGVIVCQDTTSPLHQSVWFSHDTSVKNEEGRTFADALVSTNIDPQGDLVFGHQVWWYGEDTGRTHIFGGTGKWKGIEGEMKTQGMLPRKDDHFMLKMKVFYSLPTD